MGRKEEILASLGGKADKKHLEKLIDEVVFLEERLAETSKLPFIKVHPTNSELQKTTPAGKLYIQLTAQYNSAMRTLISLSGGDGSSEESPLRKWVKNHVNPK